MKLLFTIFVSVFLFAGCISGSAKNIEKPILNTDVKKDSCRLSKTNMNGVSFENVSYAIDSSHVQSIKKVNATWVTTMPFAFIKSGDDSVQYGQPFQWYGETRNGVRDIIELCHSKGLKVMVKPHIWAIGSWVGAIEYKTESQWENFENSYKKYIMDFAFMADSMHAEAFCIGVELKKVVIQRPEFWNVLIDSVRTVYSGAITYAANWDNYQNVTFWNKLDLIGIDAYFPISTKKTPSKEECFNGWANDFNKIKALSNSFGKKVVFTEFGYRNIDYTGKEPWDEESNDTFNNQAQENAYHALFHRFWGQNWFEGGFLWKWHPNHENIKGKINNRFTPQNKPVEQLISDLFEETN